MAALLNAMSGWRAAAPERRGCGGGAWEAAGLARRGRPAGAHARAAFTVESAVLQAAFFCALLMPSQIASGAAWPLHVPARRGPVRCGATPAAGADVQCNMWVFRACGSCRWLLLDAI